jgi:hypothetical protein
MQARHAKVEREKDAVLAEKKSLSPILEYFLVAAIDMMSADETDRPTPRGICAELVDVFVDASEDRGQVEFELKQSVAREAELEKTVEQLRGNEATQAISPAPAPS